jgi:membrane protein implicated in regulation of membrane protease activity
MIVGLGIVVVQLFMSSGKDVDASGQFGGGGGKDLQLDADAHGVDADAQAHGHHDAKLDISVLAMFLSLRFWTFALMAFGLLGCFLHYLKLATPLATGLSSGALGLFSGWLAAYTFRALSRNVPNSGVSSTELVGQVGKVMLAPNAQGRSKIRLSVKGQMIDYVATSDELLEAGASVLVEEVRGQQLHVSPAPGDLKYND